MNVWDIGDLVPLSAAFSVAGVAADPTTVSLRVQAPGGTTTYTFGVDAALMRDSVGAFHLNYSPPVAGLYAYEWSGTGAAQADERGYFEVRPAYVVNTPPRFCSVGDLADFLQLAISNDSAALRAIEGATAAIQNHCHQQLVFVANDVVTLRTRGGATLLLPEQPVTSVASVVENGTTLVDETDYTWAAHGLLYRWSGDWRLSTTIAAAFGTVVVTYSHGYATIPQIVREVCIRSASRSYQSGLRTAALAGVPGVQSEQLPDYQISYQAESAGSSLGASAAPFLLPSEEKQLYPYRCKP